MSEYIKLFRKAHNKIQEIEDSPGHQISNEIKGLKNSVYIYQENFKELEEILNHFKDVDFAVELISKRYSDKRDTKVREFVRLFHNFIVSVKSLVAHARNFMNKSFQKDELLEEYDKRIEKSFRKNEEVKFLEELRNYFCHYRIPEFQTKITIDLEQNSESSDIKLLKKDLLKFDGWTRPARKFISESPDEINIRAIINRYKNITDELYNWLFNELEKLHSTELKETGKLIVEYEKISNELKKNSPFKPQ